MQEPLPSGGPDPFLDAPHRGQPLAVLISGGLESAILVGEALRHHPRVCPITVRCGLAWEPAESTHLERYLAALQCPALAPLKVLSQPVDDLYGRHWSTTGQDVPDHRSADDAVFLPGRNVFLLAKALVHCHMQGIPAIAMGPLSTNPFPDATPEFFQAMVAVVNQAVRGSVSLFLPYGRMRKREVMLRGRDLPLHLTFSCIHPVHGHHCGICNKCAERRQAFADAGLTDPTLYANQVNPCTV